MGNKYNSILPKYLEDCIAAISMAARLARARNKNQYWGPSTVAERVALQGIGILLGWFNTNNQSLRLTISDNKINTSNILQGNLENQSIYKLMVQNQGKSFSNSFVIFLKKAIKKTLIHPFDETIFRDIELTKQMSG